MKLSDCTKADLLGVVKHLCSHYLSDGDYFLERTLNDLSFHMPSSRIF